MTPHEYAVIGHRRSEVGRWIGLASIAAAPLITYPLTLASQLPFLADSLKSKLATFTVSTGLIYLGIFWFFNRYGWRWLDKLLGVPNLSGKWKARGVTLGGNGDEPTEWEREITITQTWDRMAVELNTGDSASFSESASIIIKHNNEAKLSYSYLNHPKPGKPELQKHQGFCELVFDAERRTAQGHYFNCLGRNSHGTLTLEKTES